MTIWNPRIEEREGPRYAAIAEALGEDIEGGRLAPGQQLPTQRDLAESLGVTVGTVSRAYREAEGRGLVVGEVGRGTFVRRPDPSAGTMRRSMAGEHDDDLIDLGPNFMRMPDGEILVPQALAELARDPAVVLLLEEYKPQAGLIEHREAGASLIAEAGLRVAADRVLVCAGAQHAMTVALLGLCHPGDTVLVEETTYPTMIALARSLRLHLVAVEMDEHGLSPGAFEDACRQHAPRALYCMPTLHNPTSRTMPAVRREAIAQLALHHGVAVIEDDTNGFSLEHREPSLAAQCEHLGHYLTSCSKSMAPGLRVGYLVVPRGTTSRFLDALWSTTVMAPPLMAEIASRWIRDGTAAALARARRAESKMRQRIAHEVLDGHDFEAHPTGYHVWLHLPERWRTAGSFASRAMARGVVVTPSDAFAAEPDETPAVRLSLGAPPSREALRRGLEIVAELLQGAHAMRVV